MADLHDLLLDGSEEVSKSTTLTDALTTPDPIHTQIKALWIKFEALDEDFDNYKKNILIGLCCISGVIIILIFALVFLVFWIQKLRRLVRAIDPLSRYNKVLPSKFPRPKEKQDTPSLDNLHFGNYDSGDTYADTYEGNNAPSHRNNNNIEPYEIPHIQPTSFQSRPKMPILPMNNNKDPLENPTFPYGNPARNNQNSSFLNQQRSSINVAHKRNQPTGQNRPPYTDMGSPFY